MKRTEKATGEDRGTKKPSLREAMKREEKKAQDRAGGLMPFRFFQPRGEETEIVILDESMDKAFWRHEHNLQIGGKWGNLEPCIAESGPCPFCEEGSKSTIVVLLTVLVLKEYKNKKTGKVSKYTKMLLPLKRGQYPEFDKVEEIAVRKHGTLRGTCILLFRKDEETSFSTGMPTANDDGNLINDWIDEKGLSREFGHDPIVRDGKTLKKADEDIEVFDYKKLFPKPDDDVIREEHGMSIPGSRRSNRASEEDETDDIPDVPSRRRSSRSSAPVEPEPEEDDEVEEEEEELPKRRVSSRSAAPAAPSRRRATEPEEEEEYIHSEIDDDVEEEDEPDEEAPAPPRRRSSASAPPPSRGSARTPSTSSSALAARGRAGRRTAPKFED